MLFFSRRGSNDGGERSGLGTIFHCLLFPKTGCGCPFGHKAIGHPLDYAKLLCLYPISDNCLGEFALCLLFGKVCIASGFFTNDSEVRPLPGMNNFKLRFIP